MLVYPQLGSGAVAQFPILKRRRPRTVVNILPDGSTVKLSDPTGEVTEWQLSYAGLTDDEASALAQFFASTEGSLNVFTFLDPTANLFARSDQLDHAEWTKDPFISVTPGVADPTGDANGWHVANAGAAPQRIVQTIQGPGGYVYCLSVYAKAAAVGTTMTLYRGTDSTTYTVTTDWSRFTFNGPGDATLESVVFGLELPAAGSLDVFGFQVEPQAGASGYKPSRDGGVYPKTAFRDDSLSFTATDVNQHSVTVNLIHAQHQ